MARSIDKVTTLRLDCALRLIGIKLSLEVIDKIIDVVELIEIKGGKTSVEDLVKLEADWKKQAEYKEEIPIW